MPFRKYQYAKKSIDKTKLDDDAQVKIESHLTFCRGAGSNIIGNAGTTYTYLTGSDNIFIADSYKNILKAELCIRWDPMTTAGGVRLWNTTDASAIATVEPGAVGMRWSRVDITDTIKGLVGEKVLELYTKGDGTTAPVLRACWVRIVVSTAQ